jgi:hypothetical protein
MICKQKHRHSESNGCPCNSDGAQQLNDKAFRVDGTVDWWGSNYAGGCACQIPGPDAGNSYRSCCATGTGFHEGVLDSDYDCDGSGNTSQNCQTAEMDYFCCDDATGVCTQNDDDSSCHTTLGYCQDECEAPAETCADAGWDCGGSSTDPDDCYDQEGLCDCDGNPLNDDHCDCWGNEEDVIGVCGGDCQYDIDGDLVCDDVDDCIYPDIYGPGAPCCTDTDNPLPWRCWDGACADGPGGCAENPDCGDLYTCWDGECGSGNYIWNCPDGNDPPGTFGTTCSSDADCEPMIYMSANWKTGGMCGLTPSNSPSFFWAEPCCEDGTGRCDVGCGDWPFDWLDLPACTDRVVSMQPMSDDVFDCSGPLWWSGCGCGDCIEPGDFNKYEDAAGVCTTADNYC